jgi:hypothetical protein
VDSNVLPVGIGRKMTSSVDQLVKKKAAKFELKADIKSADEIQN